MSIERLIQNHLDSPGLILVGLGVAAVFLLIGLWPRSKTPTGE